MDMDKSLVLSDKKKGKSLSAGKKCSKKSVRYALRSPYDNVWPIIHESKEQLLKKFLKSLLVPASKKSSTAKEMRAHLILGVNMLTRSLEKGEVCCALLDSTFNPKFGIGHIVFMCPLKEVPLLVVPNLRQTVKNALGFPCVALGFKKYVADSKDNHFHPVYDMVIKMLPTTLTAAPSILGFKPSILSVQSSDIQFPGEKDDSSSDSDIFATSSIATVEHDLKESPKTKVLYLYRTSKKERTFKFDQPNISEPSSTSSEFISFNTKDDVMPSILSKPYNEKRRKLGVKGNDSTFSLPPRTKNRNASVRLMRKVVNPSVMLRPDKIKHLSARVDRILPNTNKPQKPKRKLLQQNLKKHS